MSAPRPRPERARARTARPAAPPAFAFDGAETPGAGTVRWMRWALWALLAALGVALAGIIVGPHKVGDYFTETDFYGAYALGAAGIQHGHLDPSRYGVIGPVYEIVLALVGSVIRDLFVAAEIISLASVLLTVWLWARLIERRTDIRLALAAALVMVVNPTLVRYGFSATTDALGLALQAAALTVLLTARGTRGAAWAGALAALAFLTRYNAIVLLPVGLIAIGFGGGRVEKRRPALLAFTAAFAALTSPWIAFSLAHGGQFASQLHHNIAYDVFARPKGMVWDEYQRTMQPQFHSLGDVIARDPGAVFAREIANVGEHLMLDARLLLGWPIGVCAVLGAVLLTLDGRARKLWPVGLAGALGFLVLVPAFHSARYSLALLPVYAILAGGAFASPRAAMAFAGGRVWLKALLVVPIAAASLWVTQRETARTLQQLPLEAYEAGHALRALAAPGDRMMVRKPHAAWIGGVAAVPFPLVDSLATLAEAARATQARWLYYASPEAEMRPAFLYLLDSSATVPGLTARWTDPKHAGVLWEIGPGFGATPAWMENDTTLVYRLSRAKLMLNPNDVRALRAVAFVDAQNGRDAQARPNLERALALAPGDPAGWRLLGEICLRLQDPDRAIAAFDRAAQLEPGDSAAQIGLGWALLLAHRPDAAAQVWKPVVSMTADPATLRRMSEVFEQQGDHESAAAARRSLAGGGR